jgi:hypothetical protein
MNKLLATIALGVLTTTAHAQYRCVENGHTLLTDRPCTSGEGQSDQQSRGKPNKVFGDAADSAYTTSTGAWRGQTQYQAKVSGGVSPEAHAVVQMSIEIDPQGKVMGASPENGCKLKGLATPGVTAAIANLDVTFSECSYKGFNRRMSGRLAVYSAKKYAQLSLSGFSIGVGKITASFDIRATMRR